jgi:hypothetical protein
MTTNKNKNPELAKLMTADMRDTAAKITGKSRDYVNRVLNPSDLRYNQLIIDVCQKLVNAKDNTIQIIKVEVNRGGVK